MSDPRQMPQDAGVLHASFTVGALTMLAFAIGTPPALLSLSAIILTDCQGIKP